MGRYKYKVVDERGREGIPTDDLSRSKEYLLAWVSQDLEQKVEIHIFGNPAGLRHLAQLLLRAADLDQTKALDPAESHFHCHVHTGLNTAVRGELPILTIGRVDSKLNPQKLVDVFPSLVPRFCKESMIDPSYMPREPK
ncbi:MAG: hypothetical protein WA117_11820 [Verrucomicrobiia bacterium]